LWDLLASKKITQRIASLIGNDVICWRSQFFEKSPGEIGTFWHQTGTFQESSAKPKLLATNPMSPAIVQLTAWVALTDVTVENGCMRIIPGSFKDGRFERLAYNIQEQANDYLLTLSREDIEKAIRTLKFSTGNFVRAQLAYEFAIKEVPDLFHGYTIQDMTMKAGEFSIFSSLNTHGSYPNVTTNDNRLAIAGRYTSNDVKIYDGINEDVFVTPDATERFPVDKLGCMQVLGEDKFGYNRMAKRPDKEGVLP
jgi:chlorinating enzyme